MKNKFLIGALAMPLLFTACSNEEFVTNDVNKTLGGNMIELAKNFTLVGSKDISAATRSGMISWDGKNALAWYPTSAVALDATEILDADNWDKIGLAWLNENPGSKVYTNYRFQHYGWLNDEETAAVLDKCADNKVKNGVFFTGAASQADQFQKYNGSSYVNETSLWDGTASAYAFTATNFDNAGVDPRNGLFNTDNSTIFSGEYLVYYPFNADLKDIDYLVAKSGKVFANANTVAVSTSAASYTGDYTSLLAPEFFMVGRTQVTGGTQASSFELGQLSGMIAVKVVNDCGSTLSNIAKVVLYAKGNGFVTSAKLDASKIEDRLSAKKGAALYAAGEAVETSNTLISEAGAAISMADDTYAVFGFAALPATATEVIAIIQDNTGNTFASTIGNVEVKAGQWTGITVTINQALSNSTLYAYDQASLTNAIALAASATQTNPATIHVLGEVEVTTTGVIPDWTTITGYAANDKLIVKNSSNSLSDVKFGTTDATSVIDCNVDIEGLGCCGVNPGVLRMFGTLTAGHTINNYGRIKFGTNASSVINGVINNLVDPKDEAATPAEITIAEKTEVKLNGEINVAEGTKLTVETAGSGNVNEDATLNIFSTGKLTNNGDVVIYGNLGTQGQFINNSIVTEKVSAQITGKGVTSQAADAEYICEVNSEVRYNAAINNNPTTGIRPTTLVRFVDTTPAANQTYVLTPNNGSAIKNLKGDLINFECALSAANYITLNGKAQAAPNAAKDIATEIGDFSVTGGGLILGHKALTVNDVNVDVATSHGLNFNKVLTVKGDMNFIKTNVANCTIAEGVNVNGNVVVTAGTAPVQFGATTTSSIKGDVICKKDGMMKFEKNSVTTIYGANGFANDGKVEIVPQTALSGSDVAAIVICRSFTNFGDASKWTNNSYPSVNENL